MNEIKIREGNELTKNESKILKGIAILFMIGLHLFNRKDSVGLYTPIIFIGEDPLIYYISFLFDACVPIYCFISGYALYLRNDTFKNNIRRIINLMIRYWIILIFTCIAGIILNNEYIPKNLLTFIGNASLIKITYVGAWWFLQTYVLLVLCMPVFTKIIKEYKKEIVLVSTLLIYFICYYFRFMNPIDTEIAIIDWIINIVILFGTSQFPFVIGMLFYENKVITKLRTKYGRNNIIGISIILMCTLLHVLVKSMIVAPFIAILFIVGFVLLSFNNKVEKILVYFGNHSTNIWLLHMQFYMIFIPNIIFITDTVIGCFLILIICCLISSYIIDFIYGKLILTIYDI